MTHRHLHRLAFLILVLSILTFATSGRPVVAQSGSATTTHTVAWGDTLSSIAQQYGISANTLAAVNNLTNPNQLFAGQQLIITNAASAPNTAAASATNSTGGVHVVQAGENLFRIGLRFGVSVDVLMAANGLSDANQIYSGQRLTIPGATGTGGPITPASVPTASINSYTVRAGDTLAAIANAHGVTLSAMVQVNNISNPSVIYVGQSLVLPTGASASAAAASPAPAPAPAVTVPAATVAAGKQIVVDLSDQRTYAYQNGELIRSFIVSTGLPATPTVLGNYHIYLKWTSQTMSGPGYSLPNVPWVMYFYAGYGFHGTYWHSNFGQPMSHGCVNMTIAEAQWLYNWAPVGTAVRVVW